ncbi:hypothetical protein [Stappia sediminis]|nr:hypothetical protein [Stappia sediminis]
MTLLHLPFKASWAKEDAVYKSPDILGAAFAATGGTIGTKW